ncbi:hypothetical protein EX895_005398 [Sporisorium graminicola]|uniref:NLE domain-containing protein n=1 Tax=Sporisorium graminicola TaxID=280036 RepID=A0A4U7KPS2_9BASI|nr:hypothetical protein EX895_005398 [Sporisorium graminicola]TKY85857.1 hypothetical protein EX895_005398 [Sporisorium graminicola]
MSAITDYDSPALSSSAAAGATAAEQTVPIILTTSLDQYAIPSGPYMVPVSWRRTHLSTLVNKLVSSTSDASATAGAVPFDFIIDSALLRSTLGEYIEAGGLTLESTLTIEYVRSTLPPTRLAAFEHDDWVASVDCSFTQAKVYMTSSYDGSVRLFSPSNPTEAMHTLSTINKATVQGGRNTSLTSAKWAPNGDALVTGGMDGKVQLWSVSQSNGDDDDAWKSSRKWAGEAHNAPISAVDTAQGPQGVSVLSGGWDGIVAVWDDLPLSSSHVEFESDVDEDEDETTAKRRKTANGSSSSKTTRPSSKPGHVDPTMTLYHAPPTAHAVTGAKNVFTPTSRVTALLFERTFASSSAKDTNRAWSVGYNGLLKGWDLGSGGITHTSLSLPSSTAESRPMLSLAHLSRATLATGTMDRTIHLFDTRSSGTLGVSIANAHRGPVDALAAHPLDDHLFASASGLESAVKVWDSRSSKKALFTLDTGVASGKMGEKGVLAVDWSRDGQELVAGGKDKRITVFRGSNIGLSDNTQI